MKIRMTAGDLDEIQQRHSPIGDVADLVAVLREERLVAAKLAAVVRRFLHWRFLDWSPTPAADNYGDIMSDARAALAEFDAREAE